MGRLAARLRRKKLLYKGSILALSVISLCSMPAPPKWEPLAVHADFLSLPRPLPLGEVDLRSKDGEGEPGKVPPDILNAKIHLLLHSRFIRRSTTYDKS